MVTDTNPFTPINQALAVTRSQPAMDPTARQLAERVLSWRGNEGHLQILIHRLLEHLWGHNTVIAEYPVPKVGGRPNSLALDLWAPNRKVLLEIKSYRRLHKGPGAVAEQVTAQVKGLRARGVDGVIVGVISDGVRWWSKEFKTGKRPWKETHVVEPYLLNMFLTELGEDGPPVTEQQMVEASGATVSYRDGVVGKQCVGCLKWYEKDAFWPAPYTALEVHHECKECHKRRKRGGKKS